MRMTAMLLVCSGLFMIVQADTHTAASCSKADVQTSINAASSGDTVKVPSGSSTWSSGLLIHNKSISLIGGYGGVTTIALTNGNFVHLTRAVGGQNASRISAFTINQTSTSSTFHIESDGGLAPQGFRIDHITRNVTGNAFIEFAEGWGNAASSWEGLIDNNLITNGRVEYWGENSSTGGRYRWSEPLNLGDEHALYIEDNTFIVTSPSATNYINQVDGGEGARTIARFNTFTGGRIESHGVQTENSRSVKRWEFYYNIFTSSPSDKQYRPFLIRGGTGMVFHNTTDGNYSINVINIDNLRSHQSDVYSGMPNWGPCTGSSRVDGNQPDGEGYPCRDQIGMSTDATLWDYSGTGPIQTKAPAYFWGNTQNGSRLQVSLNCVGTAEECTRQATKQLVENRDWFQTPVGPFNGTVGVGEGTLANRPATCTPGTAYWATDQGEWNSKHDGADGQLYKCTAQNTWTLQYTPYTYPHPLTTGDPAANPILTSISVTPASAEVVISSTHQFTAIAKDQNGADMSTQPIFTWTVNGGGAISSSGLFTAENTTGGPYTVTATAGSLNGTASITIIVAPAGVLGNNSEGTATDNISDGSGNYINAARFQAATSFTALRIKAKVLGITGKYKCAIYSDNGEMPQTLLKESAEVTNPSTGWQTFSLVSSQSIQSGSYYWLAIWSDVSSTSAGIYYDATGGTTRWTSATTYGSWPNPITTTGGSSYNYCIYAEGDDGVDAEIKSIKAPATIDCNTTLRIKIYNIEGRLVQTTTLTQSQLSQLSSTVRLPNGLYVYTIGREYGSAKALLVLR